MRWTPDKLTALVLVCSCVALIATGINSEVKSILGMAAAYLFGSTIGERRRNNKVKEKEVSE
ncbi:MAG: hypothetical protein KKD77_22750 [Gammaproteobacteria bacterium]|nr:hypothetical protein [Gammaproteobacteria bacterium]